MFIRQALPCIVAIFVVVFGAAAPIHADPAPYVIDAVLSLTGPGAFLGNGHAQTLKALEDHVNQTGGIHGTPVHFAVTDDQSSPQVAVQITNDIISRKRPLLIGSDSVANCSAMAPLIKAATVAYCLTPGIHPPPGSYQYSSAVSTVDVMAVAVRYFQMRGLQRIAMMTSTDATGQDAEQSLDAALALPENKNVKRVALEHYNPTDIAVSAQMTNIKRTRPDVLFLWSYGTAFNTILRGVNDAGMSDLPAVASTANMINTQLPSLKQYGVKIYFPAYEYFARDKVAPGPLRDVLDAFYRSYPTKPDVVAGLAWDPGLLLVSALRELGTNATAPEIKRYIDRQSAFMGIDGRYNFQAIPQRGLNDKALIMTVWDPAKWDEATANYAIVSRQGGIPL